MKSILSEGRMPEFERNVELENLLHELNDLISAGESKALESYRSPQLPVIFIVGAPRSGTTLLLQWLAQSGCFAYPSNLISRFYRAPYVGALVQKMLTDPKLFFRNEMDGLGKESPVVFNSDLGKTSGIFAPNEFWYFWRRFFPYEEIQHLNNHQLTAVDIKTLLSELGALESAFKKPLAFKGLMFNWNLPFLFQALKNVVFLYIKRQPLHNMQSLLKSRKRFFGRTDEWYSFKPPEYIFLKNLDVYRQIAGQVYFTNKAITEGLRQLDTSHWLDIEYEQFCQTPETIWNGLKTKLKELGCDYLTQYNGPQQFEISRQIAISEDEKDRFENAYQEFVENELPINKNLISV